MPKMKRLGSAASVIGLSAAGRCIDWGGNAGTETWHVNYNVHCG